MSLRARLVIWAVVFAALGGTPPIWILTLPSERAQRPVLTDSIDPQRYRDHIDQLAAEIGSRSPQDGVRLDRASRYIESIWQEMGYAVQEYPYRLSSTRVRNLEITIPGLDRSAAAIVIGAHYDTVTGSPGADDNASGVALLLELSRRLRGSAPPCDLRLVAFVAEEPPYFQTEEMGSLRYARLLSRSTHIAWMVSLESVGYYDPSPGSQSYPAGLAAFYPSEGNFVGVVGNLRSRRLVEAFAEALARHVTLPVESASLPSFLPGVSWSDHWSFWQSGIPAIMLTDTAPFRNPHYHRASDTPETLDFEALALLGEALPAVVLELSRTARPRISPGFWAFLAWIGALVAAAVWAVVRGFRGQRAAREFSRRRS